MCEILIFACSRDDSNTFIVYILQWDIDLAGVFRYKRVFSKLLQLTSDHTYLV
jgi:hypothetical protein